MTRPTRARRLREYSPSYGTQTTTTREVDAVDERTDRRASDAAWARIEAKLDVAIAQHSAKLDEHTRQIAEQGAGQASLAQRVAGVEIDLAVVSAKIAGDGPFQKALDEGEKELKEIGGRLRGAEGKIAAAVGGSAVLASLGSVLLTKILGGA